MILSERDWKFTCPTERIAKSSNITITEKYSDSSNYIGADASIYFVAKNGNYISDKKFIKFSKKNTDTVDIVINVIKR